MSGQDSGQLIKQISQLFRDKEEVDGQLEKERKARARAEKALEDAEQERSQAVSLRNDAENQVRKLEEGKGLMEEQLAEERQKRFHAEKNVERLLSGLKDELLDAEGAARCQGDLRSQLGELQEAARKLHREMQTEKAEKDTLGNKISDLKGEIAKGERDRTQLENEMDDMKGRLKKMGELKLQIDAAKDQAREDVEEARRRGREQTEEERSTRLRAETMYQDAMKEAAKFDQDRRAAELSAESIQRDLDVERQKTSKFEEEKLQFEATRKEHDRVKAQADANMESVAKELDEVKADCGRLRTMLDEEKKQRNIAEEAWKEYAKRLHNERLAFVGSAGKVPTDEEIMNTVYGNINGLERDSSDEEELSQHSYSHKPRQLPRMQGINQPAALQQRNGRPKTKPAAPRGEADPPRKLQPVVVPPPQSPVPQSQMHNFSGSGFVQVPRSLRSPATQNALSENSSAQEDPSLYSQGHSVIQPYPSVTVPENLEINRQNSGSLERFGWLRHFNPLRIRSNPFVWVWRRRGEMATGVANGVVSGAEGVGRVGTKLAHSVWTWVIILALVAGSSGLAGDDSGKKNSSQQSPGSPRSPRSSMDANSKWDYQAGSFAG